MKKQVEKNMFTFVNGRWVRDKVLRYGLLRGYHSHLLKGQYPQLVCYLDIDPSLVDVNVHPAKTELRFQYQSEVQALLASAVRKRLRKADWAQAETGISSFSVDNRAISSFSKTTPINESNLKESSILGGGQALPNKEKNGELDPQKWKEEARMRAELASRHDSAQNSNDHQERDFSSINFLQPHANGQLPANFANKNNHDFKDIQWCELEYLGCFFSCYLFFQQQEDLLCVDQHAFHERILYERLQKDRKLKTQSHQLIIPELLDFMPSELAELLEIRQQLFDLGFYFVQISDKSLEIKAVPSILMNKDIVKIFTELTEGISDSQSVSTTNHILATMACHAAVKQGEKLSPDELNLLIKQAEDIDFYHNCPHGRRVLRWFSRREVEKWFDR